MPKLGTQVLFCSNMLSLTNPLYLTLSKALFKWLTLSFAFEKLLVGNSKLDRLRPGKACRCLLGSSEVKKNHLLSTLGNFIIFIFKLMENH